MAKNLARIMCTEEDKVNCPFYFKNGACRYGDKCTRRHLKPSISQTLLFPRLYDNPPVAIAMAEGHQVPEDQMYIALRHFQEFYSEIFDELSNHGEIEEMFVCDNIGDHLVGNVYVKFATEGDAETCKSKITGRRYDGKMVVPEFCPVTDFREGRCRQFEDGACGRGGYCNFMHIKHVPKNFKKALFKQMYKDHPDYLSRHKKKKDGDKKKDRSRSRSREHDDRKHKKDKKHKSRRSRSRSRSHGKHKKDKKHRRRDSEAEMMEMSSQERRAMIASWNDAGDEPEGEALVDGSADVEAGVEARVEGGYPGNSDLEVQQPFKGDPKPHEEN